MDLSQENSSSQMGDANCSAASNATFNLNDIKSGKPADWLILFNKHNIIKLVSDVKGLWHNDTSIDEYNYFPLLITTLRQSRNFKNIKQIELLNTHNMDISSIFVMTGLTHIRIEGTSSTSKLRKFIKKNESTLKEVKLERLQFLPNFEVGFSKIT